MDAASRHVDPGPVPPALLRERLARLRTVPTLPRVLETAVAALEDPELDFDRVASLIETDQALAAQLLRMANSAFYSSSGRVSRVPQALLVLGAVVSRSVVMSSTVLDLRSVPLRGFWEHSLGCAVAAGALAKVTGLGRPEEVTAAGLLHDVGKVVLCKELPEIFAAVLGRAAAERRPFREIEQALAGTDHATLAATLVQRWRFPPTLAEPIAYHHTPRQARHAPDETAIVHVANSLVRTLGYGTGGDPVVPPIDPDAWARLELTATKLDRVLDVFDGDLDQALNHALFD